MWITLAGLAVTIAVNVLFMPKYSYYAAAWGHVASYLVMMIISLILGNKYYPIPYRWGRIIFSIVFALAIYGGSLLLPELAFWPKMAVSTVLLGCYTLIIWLTLFRKPIRYESQNS